VAELRVACGTSPVFKILGLRFSLNKQNPILRGETHFHVIYETLHKTPPKLLQNPSKSNQQLEIPAIDQSSSSLKIFPLART
jgi:hypothetical protein